MKKEYIYIKRLICLLFYILSISTYNLWGDDHVDKLYLKIGKIYPGKIIQIKKDGTVIVVNSEFERSAIKVDTVVLAKVVPNDSVYEGFLEAGLNVARIGDAKKVRNVRGAVTDGANAALIIEQGAMLNANNELISNLPTGIDLS